VTLDSSGNVFGTTSAGGSITHISGGAGTVFELTSTGSGGCTAGSSLCSETVLFEFCAKSPDTNCHDGYGPSDGLGLFLDSSGNLFGTTTLGGAHSVATSYLGGIVYELQGTNETVLYSFCKLSGCTDGQLPTGGLVQNSMGTLFYGVTENGGDFGHGTVYQIAP
jgi:uncharacterized repeat protein (TIGR03803 family)